MELLVLVELVLGLSVVELALGLSVVLAAGAVELALELSVALALPSVLLEEEAYGPSEEAYGPSEEAYEPSEEAYGPSVEVFTLVSVLSVDGAVIPSSPGILKSANVLINSSGVPIFSIPSINLEGV